MTRDAAREAEITRLIDHLENGPLDGSQLGAAAKHLAALLAENAALRRALADAADCLRVGDPEREHPKVGETLRKIERVLTLTPPAGGAHG